MRPQIYGWIAGSVVALLMAYVLDGFSYTTALVALLTGFLVTFFWPEGRA